MTIVSMEEARHISLLAQSFMNSCDRPARPDDIRSLFQTLGCIQIDTIHVVARSQYIIPWSRLGQYDPGWMDAALHPETRVFEYWGHAASLIDINLFPHFRRRMQVYRDRIESGNHAWAAENKHILDKVREAVWHHGPITTTFFERPNPDEPVEPWAWWGGKPTNRALELLWSAGEVMVERRVNFRRFYDHPERIVPELVKQDLPDYESDRRTLALRALHAMGIARPEWLNDYFRVKRGKQDGPEAKPQQVLEALVASGDAYKVTLDDLGPAYIATSRLDLMQQVKDGHRSTRTTLLSPFDNLIWDRRRTLELFDFEYRIECYTPAAKRKYGYFNLPILHQGELIGRLDPKVDRATGTLHINSFHLEPGQFLDTETAGSLRTTLESFAAFNGAETVQIAQNRDDLSTTLGQQFRVENASNPTRV